MGNLKISFRMIAWLLYLTTLLFNLSSPAWAERSDYDGLYAGTYYGDDNGLWGAVIDSTTFTAGFIAWSTDFDRGDIVWWAASDQAKGTITSGTDTVDDGGDGSGGGGGGGCFIQTFSR